MSETTTGFVNAAVDYKNRPVLRPNSGGWRSAAFIISVEIAERFSYYGIAANLITYLTGPLGQSTAAAAANVNAWSGTASLLPLLGAFLADSFLGRYRTILIASALYILGLGLLTLSAILLSVVGSSCRRNSERPCSPPLFQVILFFSSLYVVAIAQGGHKPCTQAFGADQFDSQHPAETRAKSSFFNWWYFGVCAGALVTVFVVSYIQENLSWSLGFGIPWIAMVVALVVFLLGTKTYRYVVSENEKGPFERIGRVFVAAFRNRRAAADTEVPLRSSKQFIFLNKAMAKPNQFDDDSRVNCSAAEVEEAKVVLRLIPIWCSCLIYGAVFAQTSTFFTKQGATMEREIFSGFQIPAASLQCFIGVAALAFVPVYDRVLVPTARRLTGKQSGITMLQRIGTGMFVSVLATAVSALVETRRLGAAKQHGLVDKAKSTVPMSVWWLVPQYAMFGIADVFTMVGLQEFFYDQVPAELRSIGLALYFSVFGVGSFLSGFLVSVIDKATGSGGDSWFSNDLNRAHLDYFYWLLSGLSALGFVCYLYFAKSYIYSR